MATFSDTDLHAAEVIIGALDSPLRVQIIRRLAERDHFVHELVRGLGKSQPLISQHLRVLKRSGLVDSERRGREVIYRLAVPEVSELIDAAVDIGRRARQRHEGAEVISLHHGTGLGHESFGRYAHAPAAAVAVPSDIAPDTIPDPSPTPPMPQSFT